MLQGLNCNFKLQRCNEGEIVDSHLKEIKIIGIF